MNRKRLTANNIIRLKPNNVDPKEYLELRIYKDGSYLCFIHANTEDSEQKLLSIARHKGWKVG